MVLSLANVFLLCSVLLFDFGLSAEFFNEHFLLSLGSLEFLLGGAGLREFGSFSARIFSTWGTLRDPFGVFGLAGEVIVVLRASSSSVRVSEKISPWISSICEIILSSILSFVGLVPAKLRTCSWSGLVILSIDGVGTGATAVCRGSII